MHAVFISDDNILYVSDSSRRNEVDMRTNKFRKIKWNAANNKQQREGNHFGRTFARIIVNNFI